MAECKVDQNAKNCGCSYDGCSRKGICCECIKYHYGSGQLPGCVFPADVEKTYDRTIETFVKTYQQRGAWW